MPLRAALFDLDGTLVDSAGDLAAAANRMLATLGRPPRSLDEVKAYVGKGIARLVERCLTGDLDARADPGLLERALALFRPMYDEESGVHSAVYPGVVEGLEALRRKRIRLACVTNKARRFTVPLLERKGLLHFFDAVACGDEVAAGKPAPDVYLLSLTRLQVQAHEAVAVGDSENDVRAARAAGLRVLCVPYGYNEGRPVDGLDHDGIVPDLRELAGVLEAKFGA